MRVKWINELVDGNGDYLPHLLPVDPTLHWANPPGGTTSGTAGRRSRRRPVATRVRCRSSRMCTALSAWPTTATAMQKPGICLPPNNIPAGYATEGTWYEFFAGKAAGRIRRRAGGPGSRRSSTRTGPCLDDLVPRPRARHDPAERVCRPGRLLHHPRRPGRGRRGARQRDRRPGVACRARRRGRTTSSRPTSPTGRSRSRSRTARSIPTARSSIPDSRVFFDGIVRDLHPRGRVLADLEPRVLRQHDHGQRQHLAVPDSGAAPLPVPLPQRLPVALPHPRLRRDPRRRGMADRERGRVPRRAGEPHRRSTRTGCSMALAERADMIVDFSNVPAGNYVLGNVGPDEPFGGGDPGDDFEVADPGTTGQVMQFRVVPAVERRDTTPPQFLQLPAITPLPAATVTRQLALIEEASEGPTTRRRGRGPGRGAARHGRCRRAWTAARVDGPGDREPGRRRDRDLGDLQHHRRRPPDAHPRDRVRGGQPRGSRPERRR